MDGVEVKINPAGLAQIAELRRIVQRGAAAREELAGLMRRLAVEAGVDLEEPAQIRIVKDSLLILPEVLPTTEKGGHLE